MRLWIAAALLTAAACSSGSSSVCNPGASQGCNDDGGCLGTQLCLADGTGWGSCACLGDGGCAPGEVLACTTSTGCDGGSQTCSSDGTTWSDCVCPQICSPGVTEPCTNYVADCSGQWTCNAAGTTFSACACTQVCTPNSTQSCSGAGACQGTETCTSNGTGWGACNCTQLCIPPSQQSCTGPNGCGGVQYCEQSGEAWGVCDCSQCTPGTGQDCCQAGVTQGCTGTDGCTGSHTCTSDGQGWTDCACAGGNVGALDFAWTFGGEACEPAGVAYVAVTVGDAGSLFPCRAADGGPGGVLAGLPAGAISYTLTGEDVGQSARYAFQGSANVPAQGSGAAGGNLAAITGALGTSAVAFHWTFSGQSCAAAGISQVTFSVTAPSDPSAPKGSTFPCTGDGGFDGATVPGLAAGNYPYSIVASADAGTYQVSTLVHADGLAADAVEVDVPPSTESSATGSLSAGWSFGGAACADAGVDHVHLFLVDFAGQIANDAKGATTQRELACGAADAGYPALLPGNYWIDVQGLANGAVAYESLNTQASVFSGAQGGVTVDAPAVP